MKKREVDIVVIGAGPSLTTCISELKSIYNKKNRPVFICVATATKLLVDAKIIPDYVVIIDKDTRLPHPLISNFSNMWKSKLIYLPLVFPKILGEWEGERYAAYSASPMYDKAKVLYPKGSLFSGGLHLRTFVIYTPSSLFLPIAANILFKSLPDLPTKGSPSWSSSSPGASPTNISSAFESPTPKTKLFLVLPREHS